MRRRTSDRAGKRVERLTLYARQLGWLHATPEKMKRSRMEEARRAGLPLHLPEIDAGRYLIDAMLVLSPVRSDGMGPRAADWPEIDAFARTTGRISEPWEIEAIFAMCHAYADELQRGKNPLSIAPVVREG